MEKIEKGVERGSINNVWEKVITSWSINFNMQCSVYHKIADKCRCIAYNFTSIITHILSVTCVLREAHIEEKKINPRESELHARITFQILFPSIDIFSWIKHFSWFKSLPLRELLVPLNEHFFAFYLLILIARSMKPLHVFFTPTLRTLLCYMKP